MIDWLDECADPQFPDTTNALKYPDGLLAAGGNITPPWLYYAYTRGIFPWHGEDEPRLWWTPSPRAVILPDTFRISRTIRKELKRSPLSFTSNLAFKQVMTACAEVHAEQSGTWIQPEMIDEYHRLASAGFALSVECWNDQGGLVGGFYGIRIGQAFFGESMFSRQSNTAKLAFACAAPQLFDNGIKIIDCQMHTEHLARFGIVNLDRRSFENHLFQATSHQPTRPLLPTWLDHSAATSSAMPSEVPR
ncbi:leucyl/phenylalanyl-tRNA--protein transferase [Oceanobacter sp. 5_MG-2023]|uniref:leucyl/phenylalanyl-tRNA--protein transferase n=1 Tax=Oceanobacter sp. 5_MG-2023 TaxID=3062645 RepID=UPI0026E190E4|nr:leucyl/phenylalanyl-tRNA--protein transferase [Oceanobacter sp. 5_MG-2023]MDO6681080.1 leucyl/phenylalanyl-tRNA--protein transferase [Oceanobacter sp. 5_MG-2023]